MAFWLIGQSGHPSAAFALALAAGLIFLLSAAELIRISQSAGRRAAARAVRRSFAGEPARSG